MADPLAEAAAAAMDQQGDVDAAQRALLDGIGQIATARWYDVGSPGQSVLVVLPGWPSLRPPSEFIVYPVDPGA